MSLRKHGASDMLSEFAWHWAYLKKQRCQGLALGVAWRLWAVTKTMDRFGFTRTMGWDDLGGLWIRHRLERNHRGAVR